MPSRYDMIHKAHKYIDSDVDLGPGEPPILDGIKKERQCRANYLRLDRLLLRMKVDRESREAAAPQGQLDLFDLRDAA